MHQAAKHVALGRQAEHGFACDHLQIDGKVRCPRPHHAQRLREHGGVHQETVAALLRLGPWARREKHGHPFRRGGALVEQGSVRHLHARQIHHHGLEIQERLEASLCDFRLVRRVGRVPPGVFKDVASNHAGHLGRVVAHPDVVPEHHVLGGQTVDVFEVFALGQRRADIQAFAEANRARHGAFNEVIQGRRAEGTEHGVLVFQAGAQMPRNETSNLHENQRKAG